MCKKWRYCKHVDVKLKEKMLVCCLLNCAVVMLVVLSERDRNQWLRCGTHGYVDMVL